MELDIPYIDEETASISAYNMGLVAGFEPSLYGFYPPHYAKSLIDNH